MPTNEYLIEHYKSVIYPYIGEHYLAEYFSWNIQSRLILTKTEKQLIDCLKIGMNTYRKDFEIRNIWRVDVKYSTKEHFIKTAKITFENDMDLYKNRLFGEVSDYLDLTGNLINGFELCDKYEFEYGELSEDDDKDFFIEHHLDCLNCKYKITFKGLDEDFFIRNNPLNKVINKFDDIMPSKSIRGPGLFSGSGVIESTGIVITPALVYFDVIEDLGIDYKDLMTSYKNNLKSHEERVEKNRERFEISNKEKQIKTLEKKFKEMKWKPE